MLASKYSIIVGIRTTRTDGLNFILFFLIFAAQGEPQSADKSPVVAHDLLTLELPLVDDMSFIETVRCRGNTVVPAKLSYNHDAVIHYPYISDSDSCLTYLSSNGVILVLQVVLLPVHIEPSRLAPPCLLVLKDSVHVVTVPDSRTLDDDVMLPCSV